MFTELEKAHITEVKKDIRNYVKKYKEQFYPNMLWYLTWVQSRRGGHYIFEKKVFEDE